MNTKIFQAEIWKPDDLRLLLISTLLCVLVVLDANMVALSLPSISGSLTASFQQLEWVISAYMITFASCLLPAGALADRYGRKRVLLFGLALFTLSSIGCGVASSMTFLNISRAFQGIGAALQLTSALAIIANAFTHRPIAAKAWGMWGTFVGLSICIAPMLGGMLTELIGWRSIFLINFPLGIVIAICVNRILPESKSAVNRKIDVMGSLLFPLALAVLIWTLISAGSIGFSNHDTLINIAISALLFLIFVVVELQQKQPMVDFNLFHNPRFTAGVVGMFGYSASAQVLMNFFPLYLQTWFDLTPLLAGVSMLPFAAAMVIGPYAGNLIGQGKSAHWLLSVGLLIVCIGNLLTAYMAMEPHYIYVALGMFVIGFGAGVLNGTTQRAIMSEAPMENSGMVSGVAQSTRFASIVLAVGVLGGVLSQRAHSAFTSFSVRTTGLDQLAASKFLDRVITGNGRDIANRAGFNNMHTALDAARASAASGFSAVLFIAAIVAVACSIVIYFLSRKPAVTADLLRE